MHRVKAVSVVLTALLLLLIASAVFAQYSPDVLIVDQDVVDGEVIVARATVNGPGWVAIYADDGGEPGEVIGYAPLMNGINANIMVDLDLENVTDQLYAVLHEDMGFVGTFEYPGDDMPVMVDDEMIVAPFQATGSGNTIGGTVSESEGFGKLLAALQAADLFNVLRGDGPFTVFAPTDEAFDAMPADELDELLRDTEALGKVLRGHVVAGELTAEDLVDGFEAETLDGNPLTFTVDGDTVLVNDAAIVETKDGPVNGIIHAITSLLMPAGEEEAAAEVEEEEPEAPSSVAGSYQESDGSSVIVANLVAGSDGWLAIRIDESFAPGDVLGYVAVPAGEHENVVVELDEPLAENAMVWAVLHADDGKTGVFEFPDADEPVHYNNSSVMAPFNVAIVEMAEEEAMAEESETAEKATETTDDAETGVMANVTDSVTSFLGSFLTLKQPAAVEATPEAEEAAVVEEVAEVEPTEEPAEEAVVEEATPEAETETTGDTGEAETGVMAGLTDTVSSFLGSFLTLGQATPAEEAVAEETPMAEEAAEEAAAEEVEVMEPMDIVDTAMAAGSFETLAAALKAADLVDALKAEGPFTVFAPTDDSFAALPEGALDELLQDPEKLAQVLLYHVVPDKLMATDITKIGEALTLAGDMLPLSIDGEIVMAGEAMVIGADVEATNGVIHVIDSVLMPPMVEEAAVVEEEEEEPEAPSSISARYQESDGSSVTVANVVAGSDSWLAIRADEAFAPGAVLGYAATPAGEYMDLVIELDEPLTEDAMVWAVLHVDDGEIGLFEFPDGDEPLHYNNAIVMGPFNVAVAGADEEEAMTEETPVPEEEAEEPMAEETPVLEEEAEEPMAEETPVPEEEAEEPMAEETRSPKKRPKNQWLRRPRSPKKRPKNQWLKRPRS